MCGYCFEGGNLSYDTMHQEVLPAELQVLIPTNLQDSLDIRLAMDSITPQQAEYEPVANVICCRGLEVLIAEGFSSENYQALLNNPKFMSAVDVFTGEVCKQRYLADDSRFNLAVARWLLDKQVFTEDGYLTGQMSHWTLSDGVALLKQYADFYLNGAGHKRNDLNKLLETGGILSLTFALRIVRHFQIASPPSGVPSIGLAVRRKMCP